MTLHTDLMIDLETLGTRPGSVITQIGLCAFDADQPNGITIARLCHVDPAPQIKLGARMDWETVRWWLQQDEAARNLMAAVGRLSLVETFAWVKEFMSYYTKPNCRVWGNGSCFDIVLLENLYFRAECDVPWSFRNIRDMRTLADQCPNVPRITPKEAHNACADAQAQARTVQRYVEALHVKGQTQPIPDERGVVVG